MRKFRKERNMTLMELSNVTNIDYRTLSRYERRERVPSLKNAEKIAKALNLTIEELIYSLNSEDQL
ncbi:MAG: helix-turn-helix transcriptional regulator [Clostridia bacterium]|nr:helix-turn-helix transcriptional regulator [Clostridia bacterium]